MLNPLYGMYWNSNSSFVDKWGKRGDEGVSILGTPPPSCGSRNRPPPPAAAVQRKKNESHLWPTPSSSEDSGPPHSYRSARPKACHGGARASISSTFRGRSAATGVCVRQVYCNYNQLLAREKGGLKRIRKISGDRSAHPAAPGS